MRGCTHRRTRSRSGRPPACGRPRLDDRLGAGVDVEVAGVGLVRRRWRCARCRAAGPGRAGRRRARAGRRAAGRARAAGVGRPRHVGEQRHRLVGVLGHQRRRTPPRRARRRSGDTSSKLGVAGELAPRHRRPLGLVDRRGRLRPLLQDGEAPVGAGAFPVVVAVAVGRMRRAEHLAPQLGDDLLGRAQAALAQPHPAGQGDEHGVEADRRRSSTGCSRSAASDVTTAVASSAPRTDEPTRRSGWSRVRRTSSTIRSTHDGSAAGDGPRRRSPPPRPPSGSRR